MSVAVVEAGGMGNVRNGDVKGLMDPKRWNWDKIRFWANVVAPFYLVAFAFLRSYLETGPFALKFQPSYYRSFHQVIWYVNVMLCVLMVGAAIIRVCVVRVMWMFYGVTVIGVPVLWAWLTGHRLAVEYHHGPWWIIMRDVLSFCLTAPHNMPLTIDGMISFVGSLAVGYWYTRSWKRGLAAAVAGFVIVNFFATAWVGPPCEPRMIFNVQSAWSLQPFLATLHLDIGSILVVLFLWRAGQFSSDARYWKAAALASLFTWLAFFMCAWLVGWFSTPADSLLAGAFPATCAFLFTRIIFWIKGHTGKKVPFAAMAGVLLFQLAVLGPIYWGRQEELTFHPGFLPAHKTPPFSHLHVPYSGPFDFSGPKP